jgi:hypothetical protein
VPAQGRATEKRPGRCNESLRSISKHLPQVVQNAEQHQAFGAFSNMLHHPEGIHSVGVSISCFPLRCEHTLLSDCADVV